MPMTAMLEGAPISAYDVSAEAWAGILNMAQGVFAAIRNPSSHSTDELPKQEALEQLATLSILARWVERCELVEA